MTELAYCKTQAEIDEENEMAQFAEFYLKGLGVKVRTDEYGFYRNTFDILQDFGRYLIRTNKIDLAEFYANKLATVKILED